MSKYVLDAYALVEYFRGSRKGEKVSDLLKDSLNEFFMHKITYSEVISVTKRQGFNTEMASNIILSSSKLVEGDLDFFKEVGLLQAELRKKTKDFGLADAFVLLTARKMGAKVVTGDPHFKGFKEVIFLG